MIYCEDGAVAEVAIVSEATTHTEGREFLVLQLRVLRHMRPSPIFGALPAPGSVFEVSRRRGSEHAVGWELYYPAPPLLWSLMAGSGRTGRAMSGRLYRVVRRVHRGRTNRVGYRWYAETEGRVAGVCRTIKDAKWRAQVAETLAEGRLR